ncbi:MAG: energy transducer TonB [Bacteroidetes bacterium]|nr:MAG: energy transducer TonB [Bacteroidota bacterium]
MSEGKKYSKPKKFLKMPHLHGGKEQLREFLKKNLTYPQQALENQIQGDVIIKYKISDNGEVSDPTIIKSLGHGCDEEAIRLVKMIKYDSVKNRGVRVTAHNRIKIPFRLPKQKKQQIKMVYTQKSSGDKNPKKKAEKPKSPKTTYTYTIKF